MTTCRLCRSLRVETFFERERYPLCGAPVISAEQQTQVKYAAIKSGICPDCGYIMLVAPLPEEVKEIIYDGFYVSSNPVASDPSVVTDARVIQLLDFMSPLLR